MKNEISPTVWSEISEHFHTLVELSATERTVILSQMPDARKRAEIEKLLAADDAEREFLETSPLVATVEIESAKMPERIGRYKILREIGRGGMGTVLLAEREDLKKQFALKIIKRGMDTDEILRRFQIERQILAALEHPNIARLIDVGVSDDGLPFFVMEYIAGADLISFSTENRLSLVERLAVFRKICAAVGYAHQKLVVHRDLKPSNILVTKDGEPKLLDFGISKLLTADAEATGTATALGMMTPNYAAPEQFRDETVSTATDVYSLGVILYELLTGDLPYKIKEARFEEAARIVAEIEPPKPSAAVTFKSQTSTSKSLANSEIATKDAGAKSEKQTWLEEISKKQNTKNQNRNTFRQTPLVNPKLLRGDLDNIVLKALRKEPARRYATIEQFSEDIRRHLEGLPVTARADTFSYRASKFINRNKFSVGSAALVAVALVGGIAGTSWQAIRAENQRALAEKRFGEVRTLANNAVFKYYEQIKDLDGATEARATLVKDATEYLDRLAQDAGEDVSLRRDLAKAYFRLGDVLGAPGAASNAGDTAGALENYRKAGAIADDLIADFPNDAEFINLKRNIHTKTGEVYQRSGDDAATRKNFLAAIELSKKLVGGEQNNPAHLSALGQAYVLYGETLPLGTGENESVKVASEGLPYLEKALAAAPNESVPLQRMNMANIRIGLQIYGLAREAEEYGNRTTSEILYKQAAEQFEKATETAQKLVAVDGKNAGFVRRLFVSKFNKSTALSGLGKTDEALRIQKEMLVQTEKTSGADAANGEAQFDLAQSYYEIGRTFARRREFAAASENICRAIAIYDRIIAKDAENSQVQKFKFEAQLKLGDVFLESENQSRAVELYRTAQIEAAAAPKLKDTPFTEFAMGLTQIKIGDSHARRNDFSAARAAYQNAAEHWRNPVAAPEKFGYSAALPGALQQKINRSSEIVAQ